MTFKAIWTGSFESSEPSVPLTSAQPIAKASVRPAPLAGSVKNATARYDLPSPALAVRNLVKQPCLLKPKSLSLPQSGLKSLRVGKNINAQLKLHPGCKD